jgi:hypothetical protein
MNYEALLIHQAPVGCIASNFSVFSFSEFGCWEDMRFTGKNL